MTSAQFTVLLCVAGVLWLVLLYRAARGKE